jgi:ArsR family transcriptional regulator, nickel/cobalt-responsive transcriptional repressor
VLSRIGHGDDGNIERLFDDAGHARAAADHAGPATVGELAAAVVMEGSAVSHQLRLLRHPGLVVGPRGGRRMVYAISTEPTTGS